jgi:LysR family nitrogen assimilation transcriptional regulator
MTVNFKSLNSFVTAVDTMSISAAANALKMAQPALSQQIATLERHFKQRLLIRSNTGVMPTNAGRELYRHATLLLGQLKLAEIEVAKRKGSIQGSVSVGIATYSTISTLTMPLLQSVRSEYPEISLHVNDSFGLVLSELVMNGRMDMAVIYAPSPIKGISLQPLLIEELYLIAPNGVGLPFAGETEIPLAELAGVELILPGRRHLLRQLIDEAFAHARMKPRITVEIESVATLRQAIGAGLGSTILPWAVAGSFNWPERPIIRKVVEPTLESTVSLCTSDYLPMSDSSMAVRSILLGLVGEHAKLGNRAGVRIPQ